MPIGSSSAVVLANGFWSRPAATTTRAVGRSTALASFAITMNGNRIFPGTKLPAPWVSATLGPGPFSSEPIVCGDEVAVGPAWDAPQPATRSAATATTATGRPTLRV
jgi:hypothetical protein